MLESPFAIRACFFPALQDYVLECGGPPGAMRGWDVTVDVRREGSTAGTCVSERCFLFCLFCCVLFCFAFGACPVQYT